MGFTIPTSKALKLFKKFTQQNRTEQNNSPTNRQSEMQVIRILITKNTCEPSDVHEVIKMHKCMHM